MHAFAAAYTAYLDARGGSSRLSYASVSSREEAAAGGQISPAERDGRLRLVSFAVQGQTAYSAQALAAASDRSRSYPFTLRATLAAGRWTVTQITPPDLTVDDHTTAPAATSVPNAARVAARAFALAYANYTEDARRAPPRALAVAINEIDAGGDPLAGAPPTHQPGTLRSLRYGPLQAQRFAATATVATGGRLLRFTFLMLHTRKGWEADGFPQV